MHKTTKVLWGEGLFLRPQHFQLQDSYHEQHLSQTVQATVPYSFGIRKILFDSVQLQHNVLALEKVDMLWQDHELYSAPAQDLLPAPVQLDSLNLRGEILVCLALPFVQPHRENIMHGEHALTGRYHTYLSETHDLFTDSPAAEISLLRKQAEFRLVDHLSDSSFSVDGMLCLPVAKLLRHSSGTFELDDKFIPPVLHVESSPHLLAQLKRTLNIIRAKIKSIQANNRENEQKIIEFRSGDIISFWLVNALNTAHAVLNHIYQHPQIHPERLFSEMLRLTGSLLTFSNTYHIEKLPIYEHTHLKQSFHGLDVILRGLLDTIISSRYLSISMQEVRPSYWTGSLESDKINQNSRLYLAVSSSVMQSHELIKIVPLRFKVGNTVDVEQRVVAALPAIPLHHMVQIPTAIPVRSGVSYFELEANHELYQRMLEAESVCIYIPSGFQDISIELIAVVQQSQQES